MRRKPHLPRLGIKHDKIKNNRLMEKKLYQQPKTVSTLMEPQSVLCASPGTNGIPQWDTPQDGITGN